MIDDYYLQCIFEMKYIKDLFKMKWALLVYQLCPLNTGSFNSSESSHFHERPKQRDREYVLFLSRRRARSELVSLLDSDYVFTAPLSSHHFAQVPKRPHTFFLHGPLGERHGRRGQGVGGQKEHVKDRADVKCSTGFRSKLSDKTTCIYI